MLYITREGEFYELKSEKNENDFHVSEYTENIPSVAYRERIFG